MSIFKSKTELPEVMPITNDSLDFSAIQPDYTQLVTGVDRSLKRKVLATSLIPIAMVLLLVFLLTSWKINSRTSQEDTADREQAPNNLVDASKLPEPSFSVGDDISEIVFNNTIVSNGAIVLSPKLQPTESTTGQLYYDEESNQIKLFNGESYISLVSITDTQQICFVGSDCGFLTIGDIPTAVELPQDLRVTASPTFAGLTLTTDLSVANGGTGASSFANNTVLIGNGSGAIGTTNTPASGQLLVTNASGVPQFITVSGDILISSAGVSTIGANTVDASELVNTAVTPGTYGNGSDYPVFTVDADGRITSASSLTLPGGGSGVGSLNTLVGSLVLQGTANQVNVVSGGSTITLSTPQDIATTSSPTFNGLTVTSLTLSGDNVTDITGTGLQVSAGLLQTTLGTTIDGTEIVNGSVANVDLANSSLTVSAGTGLSGGGSVSLGGTVILSLANDFGASIDTGEITNGTILFADLSQNGCANDEVIKWSTGGSAWVCSPDSTGSGTNTFATIATPAGTSPVADNTTDTLTLANGSGITITGDGTTDTVTIAAVLGADVDLTSEGNRNTTSTKRWY
jgi:hypothetical protein